MPKFIHTADWQIGRQYDRFGPDEGALLAEARIQAVERIAKLAVDESVDAVLVAGDVFDAQTVSDKTIRRLFNAMQAYNGHWILIPGNHDAALAESVWSRATRINAVPANVTIATTPEAVVFADKGFVVLPAPLTQRHTHDDLTAWFDTAATPQGLLRIGIAHGGVEGILWEDLDAANPIAADRVERARLDYLALGDWHGTKQVNARCWYSGTPEQDRFKENDPGNVLLVEIAAKGSVPVITVIPIGQFPWVQWQQVIQIQSDIEQLIERLDAIERSGVINIRLSGHTDLAGEQRLQEALGRAEGKHRVIECDKAELRLIPTAEDIALLHADGYVGEVLADLRSRQEADNNEIAREALVILAGLLRERQAQGEGA